MKRKCSKLAAIVFDMVAPLLLYEGEVTRVEVRGPDRRTELAVRLKHAMDHREAVKRLNRRQRRAYQGARRDGASEERALAIAVRRC